jgi:RNA polymerase sigma factor, sigma-70 family
MHNDDNTLKAYEQQLFQRFCQKERQADAEMQRTFGQRLWRYIRRSLIFNDIEAAENCVQDTWLILIDEYCGKALPDSGLWSVLHTVALRQARDTVRQQNSQKRKPSGGFVSFAADPDETHDNAIWSAHPDVDLLYQQSTPEAEYLGAEEDLKKQERLTLFKQAVAQLSEKQQLALHLKYTKELSVKEIAALTGEKYETVRNHLRLAKEHLKARLG